MNVETYFKNGFAFVKNITFLIIIVLPIWLVYGQSQRIEWQASDSAIVDVRNNKIILSGNVEVESEGVKLTAPLIVYDMQRREAYAVTPDSTQGVILDMTGNKFIMQEARFNFETGRALVVNMRTQEGESQILGQKAKYMENDVVYIKDGAFTTCDATHPHFYFQISKMKIVPDKIVVAGPSYLVVEETPLPVGIPMAIYPLYEEATSGIIVPTVGQSPTQGFMFREGGYFFAINDYVNLALLGDIYTRGTWRLEALTQFKKRYKYEGFFKVGVARTLTGEALFPETQEYRDIFTELQFSTDKRTLRKSSLQADIRFGTSTYLKNTSYNPSDVLQNELASGIKWTQKISIFNSFLSLTHRQSTRTKQVSLDLPSWTLSMYRRTLFQRGRARLTASYTLNLINRISMSDSLFFGRYINLYDSFPQETPLIRRGIKHSLPINFSTPIFKFFQFSLTGTYNELWTDRVITTSETEVDTLYRPSRAPYLTANASITTNIYGTFYFRSKRLKALRHTVRPSISWQSATPLSQNISKEQQTINPFSLSPFGAPPTTYRQSLSFVLYNRLEGKFLKRDSTYSKTTLIDELSLRSGLSISDSIPLQPLSITFRSASIKGLSILLNGQWTPYTILPSGIISSQLAWDSYQKPLLLQNLSLSFNFSLQSFQVKHDSAIIGIPETPAINLAYNLNIRRIFVDSIALTQGLQVSLRWKLTSRWSVAMFSGYDFTNKTLAYTRIEIKRDLHCWTLSFSYVPFGRLRSYLISLQPKAALLQDIRIRKRKDWYEF